MKDDKMQSNGYPPIGAWIIGVALGLTVAFPVIAIGAAVAFRLFCWIAGVCI